MEDVLEGNSFRVLCGDAPSGMLSKEKEKLSVNPDFVRSSPFISIYAICVGIVP